MAKRLSSLEVTQWQERIRIGESWRKQEGEDKWRRYIGYQQSKFLEISPDGDYICVNLVHPMVKVIIPAVYSKNPDIVVIPRQERYQGAADLMQVYLRYIFKEIGLKEELKLVLLDTLLCGHGWVKTGYATQFENIDPYEGDSMISMVLKMMGIKEQDPADENRQRYAAAPNEKISDERPWALRVSPFNMVVPAMSKRPEELPWISEMLVYTMTDLKNHPEWDVPRNVSPSTDVQTLLKKTSTSPVSINNTLSDEDLNYKILYEVWDLREGCIYIIPDESDTHCYDYKENEYNFLDSRHPYLMLRFNEVPDRFYPMSDVEPWEAQIHELNATRTQMMTHRKRYNRRYVTVAGAFKPDELDKLKKGDDGTVIETTEEDVRAVITPVQDAPLPPEAYASEERVKRDITEISGITGYQRGDTQAGAKTATEAAIVEGQSRGRNEERLDVVTTFANRIAKNIATISQKFMTAGMVFPVVGDAAISWVQIKNKKQLAGDFLYDLVYGSSVSINPDVDRQQFMEFYQLTANDPFFDPVKIRMDMVRKFRLPSPETYLNKEASEMLKQKRINDAMLNNQEEEGGGGGEPSSATPDSASLQQGVETAPNVPVPGGMGGGAPIQP
jgi:hypothetical protein